MTFRKTAMRLAFASALVGVAATGTVTPALSDEPVQGGTVVYLSTKVPSLNPLHSAYEVGLVTSQIFASLVRMDENNEIAPYLAESWEISADGKIYTFNLAKDAVFHDGMPVTGQDVPSRSTSSRSITGLVRRCSVRSRATSSPTTRPWS